MALLHRVIEALANGETLSPAHRDHALSGDYIGFRDCHIQPDWLLIYQLDDGILTLTLLDTESHADLFR